MKAKIISDVKKDILKNGNKYPFIARFWDFKIFEYDENLRKSLSFGHYETKLDESIPFNKPLSKIINPAKL